MTSPNSKSLLVTNRYLRDPELRAILTRRTIADSCLVKGIRVEKPELASGLLARLKTSS
jgi:hypothetical protein